ncbi:putative intracellular septation protein [Duffyella gerundensis]|uniref:Inner membrane-spanning protein YciB n=2 Tax=Duffyella gerundensis TaxID=1619313 RepID=A0A0U5LPD3_9GAMM|nr:putative intracellular septation protein [Duffyella gerundensis]
MHRRRPLRRPYSGRAMKQLLDFLPLVVFFVFYKMYDIFVASGALIVATGLALVASWILFRKVEKMTIVTFVLVAVFGTLTLVFHNDEFIKWKVTVIYSLFALALLFSQFFMQKPLIQTMLGKELQLPTHAWRRLNVAWAIFFLACGVANIYVAFWLPQEVWVNFKVFGLTGLTLLFTLLSGVYIYRLMPQEQK